MFVKFEILDCTYHDIDDYEDKVWLIPEKTEVTDRIVYSTRYIDVTEIATFGSNGAGVEVVLKNSEIYTVIDMTEEQIFDLIEQTKKGGHKCLFQKI